MISSGYQAPTLISTSGNTICIRSDLYEVNVMLWGPKLKIDMLSFHMDKLIEGRYGCEIVEGPQTGHKELMRNFSSVQRIFQCFQNEKYFKVNNRTGEITVVLDQTFSFNGLQRKRFEENVIKLQNIPLTDTDKLTFNLIALQAGMQSLQENSKKKDQEMQEIIEQNKKLRQESKNISTCVLRLQKNHKYLLHKLQKQEEQIKELTGECKQVKTDAKRRIFKTGDKKEKKAAKRDEKDSKNEGKSSRKSSGSSSSSSSDSSSQSSVEAKKRDRNMKSVKIRRNHSSTKNVQRSSKKINVPQLKSKWGSFDVVNNLVARDSLFSFLEGHKNRLTFNGKKLGWLQCMFKKPISLAQDTVFDFRIIVCFKGIVMIGLAPQNCLGNYTSIRSGKVAVGRTRRDQLGIAVKENDCVRMIVKAKQQTIEWKVGKDFEHLSESGSITMKNVLAEKLPIYPYIQMFTPDDKIELVD